MDLPTGAELELLDGLNGVVYENVGVAVVDVDPEQEFALARALSDQNNPIIAVEPEQYGHALFHGLTQQLFRAHRDPNTGCPNQQTRVRDSNPLLREHLTPAVQFRRRC